LAKAARARPQRSRHCFAPGGAYLSDEVTLLDPDKHTVFPFHLPMAIKPWTAGAAGPLPAGTDVAGQDAVRFRLPARLGYACPLGAVVLLERGGAPAIARVSRAAALLRLARQPSSFRYAHQLDNAFRAWSRALRSVPCVEIKARRPAALARALLEGRATWGDRTSPEGAARGDAGNGVDSHTDRHDVGAGEAADGQRLAYDQTLLARWGLGVR